MNDASWIDATGAAMWGLVERYTGQVGYKRGTKTNGPNDHPPAIDCSGWTALLLFARMAAANRKAGRLLFCDADVVAAHTWSDRLIEIQERRSGVIVIGDHITVAELPPFATIGSQQGGGAWAKNHPRPRGITHVVKVVHRPGDHAPYVSEAQGMAEPYGLRLLPLAEWIAGTRDNLRPGMAWEAAPFAG